MKSGLQPKPTTLSAPPGVLRNRNSVTPAPMRPSPSAVERETSATPKAGATLIWHETEPPSSPPSAHIQLYQMPLTAIVHPHLRMWEF